MYALFIIQLICCFVFAALAIHKDKFLQKLSYSYLSSKNVKDQIAHQYVIYFFIFFIQFSSIIPISLMVSIEIVKLAQSYFIDFDKLMYSEIKQKAALAKNTMLNEELGQIEYIFTDKTGTLTSNKMTFDTAVIGNECYHFEHRPD